MKQLKCGGEWELCQKAVYFYILLDFQVISESFVNKKCSVLLRALTILFTLFYLKFLLLEQSYSVTSFVFPQDANYSSCKVYDI